MEAGDDAAALEASLIENIARLDSDEVTRWESFTRLVKEGRSPENISLTFGLTELQVKRTLVLFRPGNTLFANASPKGALFARHHGAKSATPVYHPSTTEAESTHIHCCLKLILLIAISVSYRSFWTLVDKNGR